VVNLAATEPSGELTRDHQRLDRFRRVIDQNHAGLVTPSMLYAYAALERGFPYLNFTPSVGVAVPALQELAVKHHVPCYGRDGKTGETLVKTVLAPMFRARNLEVLSWAGFNILGGGDGRVLAEPLHKRSKLRSKAGVLGQALGYEPYATVGIEYVPSLGNWKTAWDFVHFRGFLGTKMSFQFIWHGCDSILAAPLVLDLVRLTEFARREGEAGPDAASRVLFQGVDGRKYRARLDPGRAGLRLGPAALRDRALEALRAEGVEAVLWQTAPLPAHPLFASGARYPNAEAALASTLVIGSQSYPLFAQSLEVVDAWADGFERAWKALRGV
jgi:Myo-inositol-1-phosphate synthase